ncbi:hypothetical protein [Methanoculleus sp.]|uniref:hypothetical protein n=1 Tax=Methanoculleus sp. TaxID=90427 RepID=UPI0025F517FC|nr:hypothetical protein [Methanoculleus sp.]MCK9319806.1 hypothetical protein [Methanoculleus sp.]
MWYPAGTTTEATNYVGNSTWIGVVRIDNVAVPEELPDWRNIKNIDKEAKKVRTIEGINYSKRLHSKIQTPRPVDKRVSKPYKREPRMTQRFAMKQVGV